jgi:alpha-mannosidase
MLSLRLKKVQSRAYMSNAASYIRRKLTREPGLDVEALLRRATCQIQFARAFVSAGFGGTMEPVEHAEQILERFDPATNELKSAVLDVEKALGPIGQHAKEFTVHLVGHGHIDMNWMWSWPETASMTHDTFASVLSLMDQYPELTYTQSQASVYALIEKYHPDMFERIKHRVKEGRWEVAAVHWVEGDKNIASGESLARHLLYTRQYFKEKFGLEPEDVQLDWEPDTFGHANTIPTILAHGGVKYYYACRTGGGHHHPRIGDERPPVFWWEGPDGSRILVNRETTWYNSYVNIGENYALPLVAFCKQTGLKDWLNIYGIGNHGGGPTRIEIEYFLESRDWPCWPSVEFSTAQNWFRLAEREILERNLDLPVVPHELNYEFTGCYTSQSAIKKANRFGENYCVEAEGLAAIGKMLGHPSGWASRNLRGAWTNVLFNQFHDILPGSGVAATRDHALGLFQETGAATGAIKRSVLSELGRRVDTASLLPDTPDGKEESELVKEGRANTPFVAGAGHNAWFSGLSTGSGGGRRFLPYIVYNPCAWPRSEIVEAVLYDLDIDPGRLVAKDESGLSYPTLVTSRAGQEWAWGHQSTRVLFPAMDVPALGYKTFLICEGSPDANVPLVRPDANERFETPHLKLQFDRYSAGLSHLETAAGEDRSLWGSDFGAWNYVIENPRGMTSWVLGELSNEQQLKAHSCRVRGDSRNEGNDIPGGGSFAYLVDRELKVADTKSSIKLRATVHGLSPRIDFEAQIDWREIGSPEDGIPGLYIEFDDDGDRSDVRRFETPFGFVDRPAGDDREVPTLRYASFGDGRLTILQDCKYGHQILNGSVRTRVLRSSFDPDHAPEVGKTTMRYSVVIHEKPPTTAELTRLGAELNHPLIVVAATLQEGELPSAKSYVEVPTDSLVLSAMKSAEDGDGLIVRLVNYSREECLAEVRFAQELVAGFERAHTCDLMERRIGDAEFSKGLLKVSVPASSFATVRLS